MAKRLAPVFLLATQINVSFVGREIVRFCDDLISESPEIVPRVFGKNRQCFPTGLISGFCVA
jgi:hypothetical protein